MTKDRARKNAARQRSAATGESYTRASRQLAGELARWRTVPAGWPAWASNHPAMAAFFPDGRRDGLAVLDADTGAQLAATTVAHVPAEGLLAAYEAEGLLGGYPGSMEWNERRQMAELGRPDLGVHRLGYETLRQWWQWSDGSWRSPAWPVERAHSVTATPDGAGGVRFEVVALATGAVVVDAVVPVPADMDTWVVLDRALDPLGYTVKSGLWTNLPGGVRYALARPGRLAERAWWTLAKVRIIREATVSAVDPRVDRTFRIGEELEMNQSGRAGQEIDRDAWWSSFDIDGAHIIKARCVEVVEVREDSPPFLALTLAHGNSPPPSSGE